MSSGVVDNWAYGGDADLNDTKPYQANGTELSDAGSLNCQGILARVRISWRAQRTRKEATQSRGVRVEGVLSGTVSAAEQYLWFSL